MRVARIAVLIVCATAAAGGQSPVVRGDSVRVSPTASESRVGIVRRLDRDSLVLQDGATFPLSALQQIEIRTTGGSMHGRKVGFGILGAIAGGAAGTYIGCIDECGSLALPGLVGGAVFGSAFGARKKERVWRVAWTPQHTIEPVVVGQATQPTVVTAPPIEPALLSTLQSGKVLRIWTDSSRYDDRFNRVDAEQRLLYLQNAAQAIPLSRIYAIDVRVDRRGDYALRVGAVASLATAMIYGFDCELSGGCDNYPVVVATSAGIGIVLGALLGSRVGSWRTLFTRSQ